MTRSLSPDRRTRSNWFVLAWLTLCSTLFAGEVSALSLSPTTATVPIGGSKTVLVSAASGEIQAESKNTAVVTVSLSNRTSTGATLTLYGKAAGSATVYVRDAKTPNVSLPVTVTNSMTVSPSSLSLTVGTTGKLTASGASGTVSASSANTKVATVSVSSNVVTVKGVAAGSAMVYVKDSKVTVNVPVTVLTSTASSSWVYKVLATNDLGMHCVDADFSVFSILPPYNVVNAQVVRRATTGKPAVVNDSIVSIRYEAVHDTAASINSTSHQLEPWAQDQLLEYAHAVYGAVLQKGQGLKGLYMPKDTPSLANNRCRGMRKADCSRPRVSRSCRRMMRATKSLPIDAARGDREGDRQGRGLPRRRAAGVRGNDLLRLPPDRRGRSENSRTSGDHLVEGRGLGDPVAREHPAAARQHATRPDLMASKPVLCAKCHYSPALDLAGTGPQGDQVGKATMSSAMHAYHSNKMQSYTDNWIRLGGTPNPDTQACYTCHPGRNTKCLRGAMTDTVNCQNCHGDMKAVGGMSALKAGGSIDGTNDGKPRRPWMDLPRCQSCHTGDAVNYLKLDPSLMASDGLRAIVAFDPADAAASPRLANNKRFAENSNNLFRFSKGHGGIACEGCHNSTHAIWANPLDAHNDNVAAKQLQGHTGTVAECSTCHAPGSLALTLNGPHGMHNVGDSRWTSGHESLAKSNVQACAACHGTNYRGTVLSRTGASRTWSTEYGTRTVAKGQVVGCYDCHNGPNP